MELFAPGRYWIVAAWVPSFLINILGEEFLWHGVVLPASGKSKPSRATPGSPAEPVPGIAVF